MIEEAAAAGLPGLVFTFVWGLDEDDDAATIAEYAKIVEAHGGRVRLVELYAEQSERIARNSTEFRLEQKRSKRDLERSHQNLLEADEQWVMNTGAAVADAAAELFERYDFLRIDNTDLSATETARVIAERFGFAAA